MNDRSESLLAELVELQRRHITNQERTIAQQEQAVAMQAQSLRQYQQAMRRVWSLVALILVLIIAPWLFNTAMALAGR